MSRGLFAFATAVVLGWVCSNGSIRAQTGGQTRDTRPSASASATKGTGVLAGIVTNEDGSIPVRFAYVVLIGTTTGQVKVSATDADGRFRFVELLADRYTVGASKPPYLGAVAGARRPARPGTPIALADGQTIANVAIRMPMGSAITGVVTDERGQPASGAQVMVQQWRMQNGERTLVPAPGGTMATDERGRYRVYGLPPGEYVVSGRATGPARSVRILNELDVDAAMRGPVDSPPLPPAPGQTYAAIYFPGTARLDDAVPVVLGTGEERDNVDIRLQLVQTVRVDGSVSFDGQPVAAGAVTMQGMSATALLRMASVRIQPDGHFTFFNVPPGSYALRVSGTGQAAGHYAGASVEVSGSDVTGVSLIFQPLIAFDGRTVFRGNLPPPPMNGRRLTVRPVPAPQPEMPAPMALLTDAGGEFEVRNIVPGRYVIDGPLSFGATSDSVTWSLESVMVDGRDVTDLPFEVTADAVPRSVVLSFTDRFQELSGRLTRATGQPAPEYTIVVFPEDKAYWLHGTRRIVTTRPDSDGQFTLSGPGPLTLPPGRYLLAAVTDLDRDEQFNPSFLTSLIGAAVHITLEPGEKKVQDLVIR